MSVHLKFDARVCNVLQNFQDTLMRKLTCKTLMEVLPADILGKVKKELEEKKMSSDFETVVGLVIAV